MAKQIFSLKKLKSSKKERENFLKKYPNADINLLEYLSNQNLADLIYQSLVPELKDEDLDKIVLHEVTDKKLLESEIYAIKVIETYILSPLHGRTKINLPWHPAKGKYKPILFLCYDAADTTALNMRASFLRFRLYECPSICFYTNNGSFYFIARYCPEKLINRNLAELMNNELKEHILYHYDNNLILRTAENNFGNLIEESYLDFGDGDTWWIEPGENPLLFFDRVDIDQMYEEEINVCMYNMPRTFNHLIQILKNRNNTGTIESMVKTKNGKTLQIFSNCQKTDRNKDKNKILDLLNKLICTDFYKDESTKNINESDTFKTGDTLQSLDYQIEEISKDILIEDDDVFVICNYTEKEEYISVYPAPKRDRSSYFGFFAEE